MDNFKVMKIFSPPFRGAWGDSIGRLWMTEYIRNLFKDVGIDIVLCDYETSGNWSEQINIDWARISNEIEVDESTYQLSTHHRHWWDIGSRLDLSLGTPLFFDLHGFVFKMVYENWYPTFNPKEQLEEAFKNLNLTDNGYIVFHLNDKSDSYNRVVDVDVNKYTHGLNEDSIISTGKYIGFGTDLSDLHPWLKLMVMIKAQEFYCSQSGFTSIASIYRKRRESYLIGYNYPNALHLGPPAISYGNVEYRTDNYEKLYYWADNDRLNGSIDWNNYHPEYTNKNFTDNFPCDYYKYNSQYEGLHFTDWNSISEMVLMSKNSHPKKLDFNRENCLVPIDTEFRIDNKEWLKLIPNNVVQWGGKFGGKEYE